MILVAHFRTVTPVFCAGADQKGPSEIRPFAIKGMLRWFYRALDGACTRDKEARLFGSAAGGGAASPIVIRVEGSLGGKTSYQERLNPRNAVTDGACYLGYSLYLGDNRRLAMEPGGEFRVRFEPRWADPPPEVRRAWLASLWLLGHLGGLGSRMRRGFGTIALTGLDGDWPEKVELPLPNLQTTPEEWRREFTRGLDRLRHWFQTPRAGNTGEPSIPQNLRLLIGPGSDDWIRALRHVGDRMRDYRARNVRPKYPDVAAFGLPLASRSQHDIIVPADRKYDRSPSRLWIRVIHVGGKYHPMVWLQQGALLPSGGIRWKKNQGRPNPLQPPSGLGVLPQFLSYLQGQGYR